MSRSLPSCGFASPGRNDRIGSLFLSRRKNDEIRTISKQSQWECSSQKLVLCSQFCPQLGVGKHKSGVRIHTLYSTLATVVDYVSWETVFMWRLMCKVSLGCAFSTHEVKKDKGLNRIRIR